MSYHPFSFKIILCLVVWTYDPCHPRNLDNPHNLSLAGIVLHPRAKGGSRYVGLMKSSMCVQKSKSLLQKHQPCFITCSGFVFPKASRRVLPCGALGQVTQSQVAQSQVT